MLIKRGPQAFNNFVRALQETNQVEVLRVLEVTRSNLSQPSHHFIRPREQTQSQPIHVRNSVEISNGDFSHSPLYQYSASPPNSAEYRLYN